MSDGYIDGPRQDTGPLKIGQDWPGYFMRGDEAIGTATVLRAISDKLENPAMRQYAAKFLRTLAAQLDECAVKPEPAESAA